MMKPLPALSENFSGHRLLLVGTVLSVLLSSGCGRSTGGGAAQTPEETKAAMQQAFAGATADVKALAGDVQAAIQSQEDGKAFLQLGALSSRPDLTAEQRAVAAQSMLSVGQKLNAAAAKGDRDAAALLESYRASK